MSTTVSINLNTEQILLARGLNTGGACQQIMTNEIFKLGDAYVPLDEHILGTTVTQETDSITYTSPYARYQYYGKVMAGNPRRATDKNLVYQGSPMRGSYWVERAWIDRGNEVIQRIANKCGGKAE